MAELKLCEQRKKLLLSSGHLLVLGGPGSGKTTIALVKAATEVAAGTLAVGQKVLFLSFARATIARVMQETLVRVPLAARSAIEINTYHGFAWEFIRAYGYLVTGHRAIRLLSPPDAASRLAGVSKPDRMVRLTQLLDEEGLLGFDLFAGLMADILERSPRLCRLLADCYPIIVLDEFQDTNHDEWRIISALGQHTRLVALADAEQRIYEFRGANPARIREFIEMFSPQIFDFGTENNRSEGTDIIMFGNDLLTGANIGKEYKDVKVEKYQYYGDEQLRPIKYAALAARKRLIDHGNSNWSLAILVTSKDMMLKVSSFLNSKLPGLPEIVHDVLIDPEGPALAAALLASLLQGAANTAELKNKLLRDVVAHIRGRGRTRGTISQVDLKLTDALTAYQGGAKLRGKNQLALIMEIDRISQERMQLNLTGDPEIDWLAVRKLIDAEENEFLSMIASDARFIRLLNRGTQLREKLAECWRATGSYRHAQDIVANALLSEHFSAATRVWSGVNLMTIHKSKGKEFDEVIIFEGGRNGRLLREKVSSNDEGQARLVLRVGVTRARKRTTLLTPIWAACPLLC